MSADRPQQLHKEPDPNRLEFMRQVGIIAMPLFFPGVRDIGPDRARELAQQFLGAFQDPKLLITRDVAIAAQFEAVYHPENGNRRSEYFLKRLNSSKDKNSHSLGFAQGLLSMINYARAVLVLVDHNFPLQDFRDMGDTFLSASDYRRRLLKRRHGALDPSWSGTELPITEDMLHLEPALGETFAHGSDTVAIIEPVGESQYTAYGLLGQFLENYDPVEEKFVPLGEIESPPSCTKNPFVTEVTFEKGN